MDKNKSLDTIDKLIKNDALLVGAFRHRISIQCRWNDFDMLRHLNNTAYFEYFDLGKTSYFNRVINDKSKEGDVNAVIANINCAFVAPVRYGEDIDVLSAVIAISEHSFYLEQQIINSVSGELKCRCTTAMVCYDVKTDQTIPLDEETINNITRYENNKVLFL